MQFNSKYKLRSLADVIKYINNSQEYYSDLQTVVSENSVTSYRVVICSGIATIRECIHIDSSFHIKLSYEGCPIPLSGYVRSAEGCKLTSLDMLTNLQTYCRNSESHYEINVIKELIQLQYYSPRGRPPYSNTVLRFDLMRYTSNSAYRHLKTFLST